MIASQEGSLEAVQWLVSLGADPKSAAAVSEFGKEAYLDCILRTAIRFARVVSTECDYRLHRWYNPLEDSVMWSGMYPCFSALISEIKQVCFLLQDGGSAMAIALMNKHLHIAKWLLSVGVSPHTIENVRSTRCWIGNYASEFLYAGCFLS